MTESRDSRGLTEAEAIERYKSKNYPKPALTADIVLLSYECDLWKVLLIRRGGHPFLGKLALPGGFADENEPIEVTAARELEEETGVTGLSMELVDIFSRPGRDPRGWVVSAAYVSVVDAEKLNVRAGDDAADARWYIIAGDGDAPLLMHGADTFTFDELAFDHAEILRAALKMQDIFL